MPEPIEILIKKGQTADDTTPESGVGEAPAAKEQGKASIQQKAMNAALIGAGKQLLTNSIREYGNITGDYLTVEAISTILSFGADIATIAIGGPVGAIYVGSKYLIQIGSQQAALYNNNQELNRMRDRMGIIATRGSRYGD